MYVDAAGGDAEPKKLYSGLCSLSTPVDTKSAQEALQFLRNLPPVGTGGTLMGSVWEDLRWQGRRRFPNVVVRLRGPEEQLIEVVTDEAGEFQVTGLKPGKYRVEPQFPQGYISEYNRTYEVTLDDRGTAAVGIDANLDGRISGQLVDREGRGYNYASLRMDATGDAPTALPSRATVFGYSSGTRGAFEFVGVPPGRYRMYLELRDTDYNNEDQRYYYPGTFERSEAALISLGRAAAVRDLKFELPKGFLVRAVEGQVLSPEGRPVADAAVSLNCERSTDPQRGVVESQTLHEVQTDAEGRFRLEAVTGTVYWLEARTRDQTYGKDVLASGMRLLATKNVRNQKLVLSKSDGSNGCEQLEELEADRIARSRPGRVGEVEALIAEARQRLSDDRLIGTPGSSVRDTLMRLRYLAPKNPEVTNLGRLLSDRLLEKSRLAMRALAYAQSALLLRAARRAGPGSDPSALALAESELSAARERSGL
jgi:hypothetical protein